MKEFFNITDKEISIIKIENAWQGYILKKQIPFSIPRLSHGLLYTISGECEYFFKSGEHFTVKTGDVFYLAKGAKYDMNVSSEKYDFIAVNFLLDDESVEFLSEDFGKVADCEKRFCRAADLWDKKSRGYLTETLSLLCEIYLKILKSPSTSYIRSQAREKIDRACEYMAAHYADSEISISKIAADIGLSSAYFRRLFVKYKGHSPQKHFINMKIDRAKELLALEWLSISEVANQCGFADVCYFSRLFSSYTGVNPSNYRKRFLSGS